MKKTWSCVLGILALPMTSWAADLQPDVNLVQDRQHVVINVPQLRLFVYKDGKFISSHPIAVGKNRTKTPIGEYQIGDKAFNPTWHVPVSIQKEMASQGKPVVKTIAPGPSNPLGPVFVRFGAPKLGLGIHGTSAPSSVPGVRSHGCVRMKSPEALQFAKNINRGSQVSVIYQMAVLSKDDKGHLWLSAYGDPYLMKNLNVGKLKEAARSWGEQNDKKIIEARIDTALKNRNGRQTCLTCQSPDSKLAATAKVTPVKWLSPENKNTEATPETDNTAPDNAEPVVEIDEPTNSPEQSMDTSAQQTLAPINTTTMPMRSRQEETELKPINQELLF